MSTKKKVNPDKGDMDVIYSNWLAQTVAIIKPRNLYLIIGRGGGKTSDFLSERLVDMVFDLPGAPVALVADTYTNLQKNILHILLEGLERKGWREGVHYVVNTPPPDVTPQMYDACPKDLREHLWRPYNRILTYKHTIVFFTGFNLTLVSLDRPSAAAGNSYVHIIGDEVKFFPESKIAKLTRAVRGYYVKYGQSPYYRGQTFMTDMPNMNNVGEYDWILRLKARMKKDQVMLALKTGYIVNDITGEIITASDDKEAELKRRLLQRWQVRYDLVRQKCSFFYIASSYINVDILRPEYFADDFSSGLEDAITAILSSKPRMSSGNKFYAALGAEHFFTDGTNKTYTDFFGIRDNEDCRILRYLRSNDPLEVGVDFGNMISMTFGQEQGKAFRILKTIYTLPPMWIREAADRFLEYFKPHKNKTLKIYYDRAGNQYQKVRQDLAGKLSAFIERDSKGHSTGWRVELMSRNQGTIYTWDEYDFMAELLPGKNPKLPRLLIDAYHAKALKCSLEITPTKIVEFKGKKRISKEKKSERLPAERLPYESTNFSDSFKYLMCRSKYLMMVKKVGGSGLSV